MEDVQIILAGLWIATVFCYIYGDVFTILTGDFKLGEIDGKPLTEKIVLVMTIIVIIPIIMIILTLELDYSVNRWMNIIVPLIFVVFNFLSIKDYPIYHKFTLSVSMIFNLVTVYNAWNWI